MSHTPEYEIWQGMRKRCTNPNTRAYKYYGGRGIKVCERWMDSFESFFADMGKRPSPTHSIDRIDNDKDYSPDNCRWATKTEQSRNQRRNHLLTLGGETLTLAEWAERHQQKYSVVLFRLAHGWDAWKALTTPKKTSSTEVDSEKKGLQAVDRMQS